MIQEKIIKYFILYNFLLLINLNNLLRLNKLLFKTN